MTSMMGNKGFSGQVSPSGTIGNKTPKGYRSGQMSQFTPEQMQLFQQMFSQVSPESYTSRLAGGDESLFNEMEAPALKQFSGLQGNLASRFSGMGMGGRKSSGFQNSANTAAQDFASQLQSQRQGLQRQAIQDLQSMSQSLLGQRPYEQFLVPKQQKQSSGWGGLAGAGIGAAGGFLAGGPAGALAGGKLGYNVGSSF